MASFLLFLFASVALADPSPSPAIEKVVRTFAAKTALSGTLLVKKKGREMEWDIGQADDASSLANSRDAIYLIASVSKGFVASAILRLWEEKKLRLEDRLSTYLPEYPAGHLIGANGKPVTLENLLTHSSGVPEAYEVPSVARVIDRSPLSFADMLAAIRDRPLGFDPGSRFEYSNTGYLLLGEVVRRVSGMPYQDFLAREIFSRVPLFRTTVGEPAIKTQLARGYVAGWHGRIDVRKKYHLVSLADSPLFADTNIYTSPSDLAAWVEAVTGGRVLGPQATRAMLTPHQQSYGYGWDIYHDAQGRLAYEHAGDYRAYQSWARRYPDDDVTLIWLGNQALADSDLDSFIAEVAAAALQSGVARLPQAGGLNLSAR